MGDQDMSRQAATRVTRRHTLATGIVLAGGGLLVNKAGRAAAQATPVPASREEQAAAIVAMAERALTDFDVRAIIVRVTVDGEELVTAAFGESMTGVPATSEMHFRNGSVAIAYMATLLLVLVDQGVVALDDPLSTWLPELPQAEAATLRMLVNMTAGYPDYVPNERFQAAFYADPFRHWTPDEQIEIGLSTPRVFAPGTNWDYSHANYVILGQALERMTGQPLADLLQEHVLSPLGLSATQSSATAAIPEPILHAFSSERRPALGIDPAVPFYEESTFWNPSWTLAEGSVQTTNIYDLATSAEAIGTGALLSPESHEAQIAPSLIGFGEPLAGCLTCHTLDRAYSFGLGVVINGSWLSQTPLFGGYSSVMSYLPSRKIAVAIATTLSEESFDEQGSYPNPRPSVRLWTEIGAYLAPDDAPPLRT
ncbi:MAG: beta-lactamase family protein [Chloroflexota bacterium]|nr:beta-lactamase family protein [Chloroflexota bacterium]